MTDSPSSVLGRLAQVDLREVWLSESAGFTPWLAQPENLKLLAETIGMELELEASEKDVGPFRADILCRASLADHWVLIENQLERTDHLHLGQLLTYAAGLKAVTIVWLARKFTEEHRAALDWLNEITDERFNFFGLEIELWRIGNSEPAPKFNVVCRPNEWTREVAERAATIAHADLTEAQQLQLDFWTGFRSYAEKHAKRIRPTKPHPQNWMWMAIGRTGFGVIAIASTYDKEKATYESQEIRAEFVLDRERSKEYFAALKQEQDTIERELGEPLGWYSAEGVRTCRIYLRRSVNLQEKEQWPEYFAWLVEKLDRLHAVFADRVKQLHLGEGQPPRLASEPEGLP